MACFSLGVICDNLDEVNDLVYPFHKEFIGYYPKEYFEKNKDEKKYLKFNKFSREIENSWKILCDEEKEKFKNIERFADVKYGYYYNEDKSDMGYYTNENGKMMCFTIGGKFDSYLNVKGSFGIKKKCNYAKIKDIIFPDRKENFGTYAIISNGKWYSVEDYADREEWFKIHCKRLIKKADDNQYLVIVECSY